MRSAVQTHQYTGSAQGIRHRSLKDPGSAVTHMAGFLLAAIGSVPMLIRAHSLHYPLAFACAAAFMISMLLLYAASSVYHSLDISEKVNSVLRKIDHMMIFVLITGTYAPCCFLIIGGAKGFILFGCVCLFSAAGMLMNALWITCPKWLSSLIYIALGWSCIFAFPEILRSCPLSAFSLLLGGGLFYTAGGIMYALKFPVFGNRFRYFRSHELFHVFVMAGSFCHYLFVYQYALHI